MASVNAQMTVDLVQQVMRLEMNEADALAFIMARDFTLQEAEYYGNRLREVFGNSQKILILPPGTKIVAIGPNEEPTE